MKHIIEINKVFKTNNYGDIQILKKLEKGYFLVRFVNTGYEVTANRANIVAGKVRDSTMNYPTTTREWENTNIEMKNNAGDIFTVIRRNSKKCIVLFKDTQYMTEAYWVNVVVGKISDPYKKTFMGVGYQGEFERVFYWQKAKQLWSNMMKRCYNPKDERGYYGRCFVSPRWQCFANFLNDLPSLENFSNWLNFEDTGIKYNLDKDLKIPNNNIYSEHTCGFELEAYNKGATSRNNYYRD